MNLRVRESDGHGVIADGRYQSPILVQWNRANGRVRTLEATLTASNSCPRIEDSKDDEGLLRSFDPSIESVMHAV